MTSSGKSSGEISRTKQRASGETFRPLPEVRVHQPGLTCAFSTSAYRDPVLQVDVEGTDPGRPKRFVT